MNIVKKAKQFLTAKKTVIQQTALMLALFCLALPANLNAQDPQPSDEQAAPRERTILRFLTTADYPPFNYYDEEGNLSGFHIDLANAICREMAVRCDIKVRNWKDIPQTFKSGDFDAIIAGLAINKKNIKTLDFTNSYMRMPARFTILKTRPQPIPSPKTIYGKSVGIVEGSAHEAYLNRFFKDAKIIKFPSQTKATAALQGGQIDYLFGDAIQTMFWLNGSLSKQCCQFRGDAYWDPLYFGEGLAIAITKGDMKLGIELNEAIHHIQTSGTFEELMLRYFPIQIY